MQRVEVCLGRTSLQFPRQWSCDSHQRHPRLGHCFDLEDDFTRVEPNDERLVAALWMVRQRRVHEPPAIRFINDRLDPACGHYPQTKLASPDSNGRSGDEFRFGRKHIDSRSPVRNPRLQAF